MLWQQNIAYLFFSDLSSSLNVLIVCLSSNVLICHRSEATGASVCNPLNKVLRKVDLHVRPACEIVEADRVFLTRREGPEHTSESVWQHRCNNATVALETDTEKRPFCFLKLEMSCSVRLRE